MGHTPGPWEVRPWGDGDYEINAADSTVCNVPGFDDDTVDIDKAEADANLIAAAPELLAGCREAVSAITYLLSNDDDDPNYADTLNTLAAAIAKAEGTEKHPLPEPPAVLTLTVAERETIEWCLEMAMVWGPRRVALIATLRGLLERLK